MILDMNFLIGVSDFLIGCAIKAIFIMNVNSLSVNYMGTRFIMIVYFACFDLEVRLSLSQGVADLNIPY